MNINFFNPRSAVLLFCLLQAAVFAALLLWRWRRKKAPSDFWLAIILIVMSSGLITPFIGFAGLYDAFKDLTFFPFELVFALAPCVYLYVVSLTNAKRKLQTKDWLHFIPALIYVVYRLILFSQSLDFKIWYDAKIQTPFVSPLQNVLVFVWNLVYLSFAVKHYRQYRGWLNDNFSDTELIKFNWLRNFLYLFVFLLFLSIAFETINRFIIPLGYFGFYYFDATMASLVYYLAIAGYLRSQPIELSFAAQNEKVEIEMEAPKKAILGEDELARLKARLQNLMTSEKPFLNSQLTLSDLSKQIGVNSNVLSFVINNGFGKNFNDFVNEYRIEEVKNKLEDGATEKLSLLGVAFDCGFNSKATFNRAFKKATGVSPKEFQAQTSLTLHKQVSNPVN